MDAGVHRHVEAHPDHLVQIYSRSVDLAEAAATFFSAGFESDEPAVVIATPAHWSLIAERLARRGWDLAALEAEGLLYVRDAELTLAAICDERGLSAEKFREVVGGLLREATPAGSHRRVRAFGEMVDLLVRRGDRAGADILESHWNELAARSNLALLCGYEVDLFNAEAHSTLLPQVHRSHAGVLADGESERFGAAVAAALTTVLGEADAKKVYARASGAHGHAPASQLALMWLSAHMPQAATRVLAVARDHYTAAA
jgi:hypothetical protein